MTIFLIILLICGVGALSLRLHKTLLSPRAVYCMAWLAMICVHSLGWVRFNPLRMNTWLMIWGSLASYTVGAFVAVAMSGKNRPLVLPSPQQWFDTVSLRRFGTVQ